MDSPDLSSRILRIDEADTTLPNDVPTKACIFADCQGTMHFNPPSAGDHELYQLGTWICTLNLMHTVDDGPTALAAVGRWICTIRWVRYPRRTLNFRPTRRGSARAMVWSC
jgi:hypothetical protein